MPGDLQSFFDLTLKTTTQSIPLYFPLSIHMFKVSLKLFLLQGQCSLKTQKNSVIPTIMNVILFNVEDVFNSIVHCVFIAVLAAL